MVSSAATTSPTAFFHTAIVPSATDTPIWGMVTSTVSVSEELTARLLDLVDGGEDGLLERWGERDGDVGRGHADDRSVEVLPALLGHERGDLGAGGARAVGLVDDHDL